VQSHGVNHLPMSDLDRSAQAAELDASRRTLEAELGLPVTTFAFPYGDEGSVPADTRVMLQDAGYGAAFLYGGGTADLRAHDRYRLPRLAMGADTNLLELLELLE
jgi:peptidoglycan/xylan/chitin deacetylase (PgdA/CDA1 family)